SGARSPAIWWSAASTTRSRCTARPRPRPARLAAGRRSPTRASGPRPKADERVGSTLPARRRMKDVGWRDRLRYRFDEFMGRGTIALILGLFVISVVLIVAVAAVVWLAGVARDQDLD